MLSHMRKAKSTGGPGTMTRGDGKTRINSTMSPSFARGSKARAGKKMARAKMGR